MTRDRRRTDGDGSAANRGARRVIAEEAYRLFVEGGGDRRSTSACWRMAEARYSRSEHGESGEDHITLRADGAGA
jgi:hypothetical protein